MLQIGDMAAENRSTVGLVCLKEIFIDFFDFIGVPNLNTNTVLVHYVRTIGKLETIAAKRLSDLLDTGCPIRTQLNVIELCEAGQNSH